MSCPRFAIFSPPGGFETEYYITGIVTITLLLEHQKIELVYILGCEVIQLCADEYSRKIR